MSTGRLLILGHHAELLAGRLTARGYQCASAATIRAVSADVRADAVVVRTGPAGASRTLKGLRAQHRFRDVPVLLEGRGVKEAAGADGVARSLAELERLLTASVAARRAAAQEAFSRSKLEVLVSLYEGLSSGQPLAEVTTTLTTRLTDVLLAENVSALFEAGASRPRPILVDAGQERSVDLAVMPTTRRALETGLPVDAEGTFCQPVRAPQPAPVALVVQRATPLSLDERAFLAAVAQAYERLAPPAELATPPAYLDRYRELVEMNQRLKALDKKKNEVLAVLTHDLRAPLNVLLGHAYLLKTDADLPAQLLPSANAVERTSRTVLELVESLLEQSRDEEGRIVLFTKSFDVAQTCQDAVEELRILAQGKGVALKAEAPVSLEVLGDELKIRQVLQNLITNALHHASGVRHITLRAKLKPRPDGDVAWVEVRDDGVLADPTALLLAFERGRGLGLSISRDFVERHGGEIWAEAPPEGGAVFAFTVPIKSQRRQLAPVPVRELPVVLVADSDPVFVRSCSLAFSGHFRLEVAKDGEEALERVRATKPELLVLSVFLPKRDGLEVLRLCREDEKTAALPVVLVSGNAELTAKVPTHELGLAEVLTKPFPMGQLLTKAAEVLQRAGRLPVGVGPGIDAPTGLFDPVGLVNRLDQECARSVRYGRPLTLVALRPVSAPLPTVTPQMANVLRTALRTPDIVGHWGQGTFIAMLPETPIESARPLAARLVSMLEPHGVEFQARLVEVPHARVGAEQLLERLMG
jgi:two-component system, sensor histidine kinase ChiS